jgi:hypothetical protein
VYQIDGETVWILTLVRKIRRDGAYGICGVDGEGKIFTKNGINFH